MGRGSTRLSTRDTGSSKHRLGRPVARASPPDAAPRGRDAPVRLELVGEERVGRVEVVGPRRDGARVVDVDGQEHVEARARRHRAAPRGREEAPPVLGPAAPRPGPQEQAQGPEGAGRPGPGPPLAEAERLGRRQRLRRAPEALQAPLEVAAERRPQARAQEVDAVAPGRRRRAQRQRRGRVGREERAQHDVEGQADERLAPRLRRVAGQQGVVVVVVVDAAAVEDRRLPGQQRVVVVGGRRRRRRRRAGEAREPRRQLLRPAELGQRRRRAARRQRRAPRRDALHHWGQPWESAAIALTPPRCPSRIGRVKGAAHDLEA